MPIKLIVNGYYRSGTTFFWNLIKNQFLEDYTVFYEPLNPNLAQYVFQEQLKNEASTLHGTKLWQEYINLDFEKRKQLFLKHPNLNYFGISSTDNLISFLKVFHDLDSNICLQTNRLHFHLLEIKKEYNQKNIHLIRHPLDVYNSMLKASALSENKIKSLIKRIFIHKTQFFNVKQEYKWINNTLGIPGHDIGTWRKRYFTSLFEKFVVTYTISNYCALKSLKEKEDLIIAYENLMNNRVDTINKISKYLELRGTDINMAEFKPKNIYNFNKAQQARLKRGIKKFNLEKEWEYIEETLKKNQISYLTE